MSKKRTRIPPEEIAPGAHIKEIDGELCIVGASGTIYRDVVFDVEQIMQLWPPKEKPDADR